MARKKKIDADIFSSEQETVEVGTPVLMESETPAEEVKSEMVEKLTETIEPENQKRTRKAKQEDRSAEIDALKAEIEALREQLQSASNRPVQAVVVDSGEKVHLLWQAPVADDNVLLIGENGMYGRIIGKSGSAFIPKNELSRILDAPMRMYIDKRWMVVVSGLNEEEKESLGVNYREGEILDKRAFLKMIEIGDEMLEIYPKLCPDHQQMVAKCYYEAYHSKKYVKRELVVALNRMKEDPAFKKIIEEMNERDLEA